jgi:RNase P/RNase MRP subunit POP5
MIREKHRYLLVEASEPIDIGIDRAARQKFERELYAALRAELGEAHYFSVNPRLVLNTGNNSFLMKCSLKGFQSLVLAFALMKQFDGREMGFYTLKSSGTIRALKDSLKMA